MSVMYRIPRLAGVGDVPVCGTTNTPGVPCTLIVGGNLGVSTSGIGPDGNQYTSQPGYPGVFLVPIGILPTLMIPQYVYDPTTNSNVPTGQMITAQYIPYYGQASFAPYSNPQGVPTTWVQTPAPVNNVSGGNTLQQVAPQPVTVTPQPSNNNLLPPGPSQTPSAGQIGAGQNVQPNTGLNVGAAQSSGFDLTGVESWLSSNWMLVAAGVGAIFLLTSMGGRK